MDAELQARKRRFAEDPSPVTLRAYLAELARRGQRSDVVATILEEPARLPTLEPRLLAEVVAPPTVGTASVLQAWQLPSDLGGVVLIEIRRSPAPTWASVLANDVLELRRVQVVGSANGTQSVLWLRRAPRSWLLVEVFSHEPEDDDVAEIEHAVRSIAAAAGATVEVLDEGPVARD